MESAFTCREHYVRYRDQSSKIANLVDPMNNNVYESPKS